MSAIKYWSISRWDSGAGVWVKDTNIPRAGLENFVRTKDSTVSFITLADGSEAKISTETRSLYRDVALTFPKQVVTTAFRTQLQSYLDNEWGIKIVIPILTGASSYSETLLEGYCTQMQEEWIIGQEGEQEYQLRLIMHEFNVDGA